MHSAIVVVKMPKETPSGHDRWLAFCAAISALQVNDAVVRLGENTWQLDFQQDPGALALLIGACDIARNYPMEFCRSTRRLNGRFPFPSSDNPRQDRRHCQPSRRGLNCGRTKARRGQEQRASIAEGRSRAGNGRPGRWPKLGTGPLTGNRTRQRFGSGGGQR
jgi:hypothetical protein